ncbi:riboflavin transporter mch5 [Fusarium denticulatum]|uniref:Riboflavin transporter mch5 n=1 Tax=Fusarium denticulatum TaxID=48507 RepID=A0A8H5UEW1_9HYPO|nr:riboflavin transporter mch5 [Fusarium denticulatum]
MNQQRQDVCGISQATPNIPLDGSTKHLQKQTDEPFPEGGIQAWTVVFGCWCGMFCTFGLVNCIGVFEEYYTSDSSPISNYGEGAISWITSLQAWGIPFGGIFFGRIFDCYGPRWLLVLGSIIYVFGLMMVSVSHSYYQFLLSQGVVSAFSSSAVFNACTSSIFTWFFSKRAYAFGVMAGMAPSTTQYLLPIINAVSIPGRILPGILADKVGRYNVAIVVALLTGVITLGLWIPGNSRAAIIGFAAVYGLVSGSLISLTPTLVAQISDVRQIGVRQGTCFTIQSFGALLGSPVAGAILSSQDGTYWGLKLFCGCSFLAAMMAFTLARTALVGLKMAKV